MSTSYVRSAAWPTRLGALLARLLMVAVRRLPHFPDPTATCPAHGVRYCSSCSGNGATCDVRRAALDGLVAGNGCAYWSFTGMHWDTCQNRRQR